MPRFSLPVFQFDRLDVRLLGYTHHTLPKWLRPPIHQPFHQLHSFPPSPRNLHRLILPLDSGPEWPAKNDLAFVRLLLSFGAGVVRGRVEEGVEHECIGGWVTSLEEKWVEGAEFRRQGNRIDDTRAEETNGQVVVFGGHGGEWMLVKKQRASQGARAITADEEGACRAGGVGEMRRHSVGVRWLSYAVESFGPL